MPGAQTLKRPARSKSPIAPMICMNAMLARRSHCLRCPDHWGAVMQRTLLAAKAILAAILIVSVPVGAGAASRIKDLANVEGVRQNQLMGYGLVVGLNGTGDTLNNIPFTKQSLTAMLERLG